MTKYLRYKYVQVLRRRRACPSAMQNASSLSRSTSSSVNCDRSSQKYRRGTALMSRCFVTKSRTVHRRRHQATSTISSRQMCRCRVHWSSFTNCYNKTSLPKVIWEEGQIAALSHTYAVKFPLVTMARSKFTSKNTASHGTILKPH